MLLVPVLWKRTANQGRNKLTSLLGATGLWSYWFRAAGRRRVKRGRARGEGDGADNEGHGVEGPHCGNSLDHQVAGGVAGVAGVAGVGVAGARRDEHLDLT